MILALETSGDTCSVAVCDEEGVLFERRFRHRMQLSRRLAGDVEGVLTDAGTDLPSIDALAVGIGPGSFTGVRIGVTTVKTWAHFLRKPVAGVSSLEAVANEFAGIAHIAALIRNRPDSVHMQIFQAADSAPSPLSEPEIVLVEDVANRLAGLSAPIILCGDGVERHREILEAQLPGGTLFGHSDSPRASTVAKVALRKLRRSDLTDPLALLPLYVAAPPIGPPAKRACP